MDAPAAAAAAPSPASEGKAKAAAGAEKERRASAAASYRQMKRAGTWKAQPGGGAGASPTASNELAAINDAQK